MNLTNDGHSPSHSSSTPAASSLRPRTRRLISIDDEYNTAAASENGSSALSSRAASPAPRSHPSRLNAANISTQAPKALRETSAALSGIWGNSWSAIQGIAKDVLGNETNDAAPDSTARRRKPMWPTHRRVTSSAPPKQWGPDSAGSQVGAGLREDRESQVRALKRRDLLTANEHLVHDSVGRIKRRNSDDRTNSSAPPVENEDRDALVYIHHVRPQDTLAGISIKYGCDLATVRRANRMWPNDSVQIKTTVVIPVDACAVKGRHVPGPEAHQEEDLLLDDHAESSDKSRHGAFSLNGLASPLQEAAHNPLAPSTSHSSVDSEPPWKHDSWVLLPNETKPTEIGRMPRRTLGFFPPARRKSMAFSDAASPSPSFDIPRSSTSTDRMNPLTSSPLQQTGSKGRSSTRTSSTSDIRGRHRSTSNNFLLHGPGGVGTMGKNVKSPGPAQDPLNKLFAPHLPNVAPPPDQEYFTPWAPSLLDADTGTSIQHGGSGARTPLGGAGLDLQEIGGAIEGWVRKVGSQASKLLSEPNTPGQGRRSAVPVLGTVGGDINDLIELRDDAFEIGEDEREDRGRLAVNDSSIRGSRQNSTARPDLNLTIRGRIGRTRGNSSKDD